jgi:hypothetical protein
MRTQGSLFAVVLVAVALASTAGVGSEVRVIGQNEGTKISFGKVSFQLPFTFPTTERVMAAAKKSRGRSEISSVRCGLISFRLDPEKFYPLIGPARLAHARFQCTVTRTQNTDPVVVFFLDQEQLILSSSAD